MEVLDPIVKFLLNNIQVVAVVVAGVVSSSQRSVKSGERGLRFTLGRATTEVGPGFHFMVPYFQTIDIVQDRSRTLDIPDQRVTTHDGIVLLVDCSVVYRIVDIRKALIQIDNLERGMTHLLPIAVQQVLGHLHSDQLRANEALDTELDRRLSALVLAWGVQIESARLTSIAPNRKSLRITQLGQSVAARKTAVQALSSVRAPIALGLVGRSTQYVQRGQRFRARETYNRWRRQWMRSLARRGLSKHASVRALRAAQIRNLPAPGPAPVKLAPARLFVLMLAVIGLIVSSCVGLLGRLIPDGFRLGESP